MAATTKAKTTKAATPTASKPVTGGGFEVHRDSLLSVMDFACLAVEKKTTIPVLGSVLVMVEAGQCRIFGTDLDRFASGLATIHSLEKERAMAFTVNAAKLRAIVRELPAREVSLIYDDEAGSLRIHCEGSKFKLVTGKEENFPAVSKLGDGALVGTYNAELMKKVTGLRPFTSNEDHRLVYSALNLRVHPNGIVASATNGHSLARYAQPVTGNAVGKFLIPAQGLSLLSALADSGKAIELFNVDGNQIMAVSGNRWVTVRLKTGEFPNVDSILSDRALQVATTVEAIREPAQRLSTVTDSAKSALLLHLSQKSVKISTLSTFGDHGGEEPLDIEQFQFRGPLNVVIELNSDLLLAALNGYTNGEKINIRFYMESPQSENDAPEQYFLPIEIEIVEVDDFGGKSRHLIMPLKA